MSQAKELIFLLKSIDEVGLKSNWDREKLESVKQDAIKDYYNQEQKIHNTNTHHVRRDLDAL
tara:strand:+ start:314 stop:499 length:186 start_codon:yes stop_codon:yes gene_type:complete